PDRLRVGLAHPVLRPLPVAPEPEGPGLPGGAMKVAADRTIVFESVSKFYGEILGVNRVNLSIQPGITSLVGPNGSGKTTLMNLTTGLVRPNSARIRVLGVTADRPEEMFGGVG